MTLSVARRSLLAASAAAVAGLSLPRAVWAQAAPLPDPAVTRLTVERRMLEVQGRAASVFGIRQPDGAHGLTLAPGRRFRVDLHNNSSEDTIIHWHGQTPPYAQDGVADMNRPLVRNGASQSYDFAARPGTHWMHSHHGLQEQLLMAAPLVVHSDEDRAADVQEVVVLLHDFTFKDPAEVLAGLTGGAAAMDHAAMGHAMPAADPHAGHAMGHAMPAHLNDVEYDAYLANDRTLDDPQVTQVAPGGRVRLRLINGATSTAFHIDLGALTGEVVAVDGCPVRPVAGRRFGVSMGQRLDILLSIPGDGGAFPVLALREGDRQQTGVVLATPGAAVRRLAVLADAEAPAVDWALESRLSPLQPLAERPVDAVFNLRLTGSMTPYVWSIEHADSGRPGPLSVKAGQRVRLNLTNANDMPHPMHLHGHSFQVVGRDGAALAGAVRDTVLVPVNSTVSVVFDADNPGRWPLHCHNLLHMAMGMMTEVIYQGFA